MSLGPSVFTVNGWLNALFRGTPFSVAQACIQLHVAEPGAAGTTAIAAETTRKAVPMAAPAAPVAGVITISNSTQVQYGNIQGSQDASHYSLWDSLTPGSGNFLGSGIINANQYTAGDTLTFAVGDIDISLNCAT
jgi:hypothetical protein